MNTIDLSLPTRLSGLISANQYRKLLTEIVNFYRTRPEKIEKLEDGILHVLSPSGEKSEFSIEGIVRNVLFYQPHQWQAIFQHILGRKIDLSAHRFFFSDYEHAKQYLKILIKPASFSRVAKENQILFRQDIPGTLSTLVFHYNEQFVFLKQPNIRDWEVSEHDLFDQAQENLRKVEVSTESIKLKSGHGIRAFVSREYSAPRMLNIDANTPELLGNYGAVFSMPANGTVFGAPLETEEDIKALWKPLLSLTIDAWSTQPSPITFDLFYYSHGKYQAFMDEIRRNFPGLYRHLNSLI